MRDERFVAEQGTGARRTAPHEGPRLLDDQGEVSTREASRILGRSERSMA